MLAVRRAGKNAEDHPLTLHRRTRVATLFPNEASLLRLVSAMAAEISEEWETGRIYLNPESE